MHCKLHSIFPILITTNIWISQLRCNNKKNPTGRKLIYWYQIWFGSILLFSHSTTDPNCCYSCNRPTQFLVLFSYSKERDPIYLLIPSLTYSVLDLIAFLSFLITINPITSLLASLTHSRSDCLIPTRWLERCRLQTSKLSFWSCNSIYLLHSISNFFLESVSCKVLFFQTFFYKGIF
jgi:hypothetical protein